MSSDREMRRRLAERFARETAQWSSAKLRACLAQPERVQAAEDRERAAAEEVAAWPDWKRRACGLPPTHPTPHQRIMQAARLGRGVRLTAEEVRTLAQDSAFRIDGTEVL